MKNNLLFTTALMATALVVSSARAETITGEHNEVVFERWGGGAFYNWEDAEVSNATFESNKITGGYGGAIAQVYSSLNIKGDTSFTTNIATANGSQGGYGGAVSLYDANLTIVDNANVVFDGNKAIGGGALYIYKNSSATIGANTVFKNNLAQGDVYGSGGAIRTDSTASAASEDVWVGTLTLNGTKFENNHADANGGAIILANNGVVSINGAAFDSNSANKYGGAIAGYVDSNNSVTITAGTVFKNNTSTLGGGAIDAVGTYSISGADFIGNSVENGPAGAVWNEGTMTIADSSFTNNSASTTGGAIQNDGTITFNGNTVFSGNTANGDLNDIHNNGTINVSGNITLDGGITNEGTINFVSGSNLTAKVDGSKVIAGDSGTIKGQTNLVLEGDANGKSIVLEGSKAEFTLSNNLYNIDLADDKKTYNISTKSSDEIASSIGADANQVGTITAVMSGGETGNATFDNVANEIKILAQTNASAAVDAVTALAPEVSPMVQSTQSETATQIFSAVSTRLSGGSVASSQEGMSSGDDMLEGVAAWAQMLYGKSKLDDTSKSEGFDADSAGVAFGIEKMVKDDVKVGVGYAYTQTDIDGFLRKTDVDAHNLMVYSEYKPADWYVNGILSYGWADYSENKYVLGNKVKADYDADTIGLQVMSGYDMMVKDVNVTPEAGLRYLHISQDSYTDTAGQKVSASDSDIVTAVIGAKAGKDFVLENGMNLRPEARLAFTYDIVNDDANSSVTLANGSSYQVEGEALDEFGVEFGLGLTADVNDKVELSVGYEGKFRKDYYDNTGLLNAKYKF